MPRKIWIVFYDAYGDCWIEKVFDSKEAAVAYMKGERCYRIEECDVVTAL